MDHARRQLLLYLLEGTRGGESRSRILAALQKRPQNAHQLAKALRLDYKTVLHHLGLLTRHALVLRLKGSSYAAPYTLAEDLLVEKELFKV